MNLLDFYNKIESICESHEDQWEDITVGVRNHIVGVIGGTPIVEVKNINLGFDWDNRKLIIDTVKPMRETDKDEVASIRKKYDEVGWSQYEIKNLKAENAKLRKRIKELEK